jgi:hypothetical protein
LAHRQTHQIRRPGHAPSAPIHGADGVFNSPPNPVAAGAFVELEACMDLICVVSACPYDLFFADWPVNLPERGPTELIVELAGD